MADNWVPVPINQKLFLNQDETANTGFQAAIENAYVNELGGQTRFPGLKDFVTLPDNGRVYLHDWRGDLMAATSKGRVYRVNKNGTVEDVTGVPISGGRRVIFAKTDKELLMAAGAEIVKYAAQKTALLSNDAPLSTHIGYIDGYVVALETDSGRFQHTTAGASDEWSPLDTFAADGSPDNINSLIVTPYRELLLGGEESIEQFERLQTGDTPFFRRWAVGEGMTLPYGSVFADNAVYTMNQLYEFVRFSGQASQPASDDIAKLIEKVDDWTDGWVGGFPNRPLNLFGQKFIVLQAPFATNPYGTKGLTLVLDYRAKRWFSLYGWDTRYGLPARYPIWSHWPLWGRHFAGGEGKIYEFTEDNHSIAGGVQRYLMRTAHLAEQSEINIDNLRITARRGIGSNTTEPTIMIRCNPDNKGFGRWAKKGLGKKGDRTMVMEFGGFGSGSTFQFEIACMDDCPIDIRKLEVQTTQLGH